MLASKTGTRKSWVTFLYVLLALLCFYPYEFYSVYFLFLPDQVYLTTIIFLVITSFILFVNSSRLRLPKTLFFILVIQFLGYFLAGLVHGSIFGAMDNLLTMILAFLLVLLIERTIGMEDFFRKYNKWIFLMALLGIIAFFLVSLFGFQPFTVVQDRIGGEDGKNLYNYILTFTKSNESMIGLIRYAGFFDEPGAMGYWGMYALVINQLFIKNRRIELFLIICLLFTLSLGYYVQVLAYLFLFHFNFKKIGHSLLLFAGITVVLIGISRTRGTENDALYERTFGRIESIQEARDGIGDFAVDDREAYTEAALNEFKANPFFGTDRKDIAVGNNVYETLALYGLIGSIFILFPFLLLLFWSYKYKDWTLFKALIVIILGFTHRPFHASLLYFFIIYCIIVMYLDSKREHSYIGA